MNRKEIRIFISSPSDCDSERNAVLRVLDEMNKTVGGREGLYFCAVRWEDLPPDLGPNPQAVIDNALGEYNILIGIMWMRFGTPIPGGANSGTEHEVLEAMRSRSQTGEPRVMFYFKQDPPEDLSKIDPVQLLRVQEFKNRLQSSGLTQTFNGTQEFESKLRIHLSKVINYFTLPVSPNRNTAISVSHKLFSAPRIKGFKGRKHELDLLVQLLNNQNISLVVVEGISGIGKTALTAYFSNTISQHGYESFWLDCREDTSFDSVTSALLAFACRNNNVELSDFLENVTLNLADRISGISAEIADSRYALFFDDYHVVNDPLVNRLLQRIAERALYTRLFLICRHRPRIATSTNPIIFAEHTLRTGLDPNACYDFLKECGIQTTIEIASKIWMLTGEGHPKALEIFVARSRTYPITELLSGLPVFREELKAEWLTPLLNELPMEQREVAITLSLFDRPITQAIILWFYPNNDMNHIIAELVDRFILDRWEENSLRMHPLIREYCYQLISDKATKHVQAAEFYLEQSNFNNKAEMIADSQIDAGIAAWSHLIKANEHIRASEVLNHLRAPLMNRGQYEQVMFLIERTPKTPETEDWYSIHKSRILSLWGDFDEAFSTISSLIDSHDASISREAILVLATIYNDHGKPEQAKELLESHRDRVLKKAHPLAYRRFLYRLVETYSLLGDLGQALSWASKIVQNCEADGDEVSGAISLRQMANVLFSQRKLEMALSLAKSSHKILINKNRLRESAITQMVIATILQEMGDLKGAANTYLESLDAFIDMGDRKNSTLCRQKIASINALLR